MKEYFVMIKQIEGYELERIIMSAENREHVKQKLLEDYIELFPDKRLYQRRKDGQIAFMTIMELDSYWKAHWNTPVICKECGKEICTKLEEHNMHTRIDYCSDECREIYEEAERLRHESGDLNWFDKGIAYIYLITNKRENKSYVGKTNNHFIWRWWNHIKAETGTPFHEMMKYADPVDLKFEVLEQLSNKDDERVFDRETYHMMKHDTLNNGYNQTVSSKAAYEKYKGEGWYNEPEGAKEE